MRLEARLFSVTYWSTTIVVMATFDSGQLASLRSLTEVFGPMCLILELDAQLSTEFRQKLNPSTDLGHDRRY